MSKLGVKTATQVSECTHLIAPGLVRTEKLLCALASGAVILSEKWAIESAAANKLLRKWILLQCEESSLTSFVAAEEDYILRDKANERKWHFRLVDAMARAKEVGGKLFENRTFYVTSKVPVDTKLLKTVVTIQGGKVRGAVFNEPPKLINVPCSFRRRCPPCVSSILRRDDMSSRVPRTFRFGDRSPKTTSSIRRSCCSLRR